MKKLSFVALVLALLLAVTACASPSGLLLKEATLQQMELESYESMTSFSVDLNSLLLKNSFELDMYAKQIDLLNSLSRIYVSPELLALAGLQGQPASDKLYLDLILVDGDLILGSSEDQVGIHLANLLEMPEGEELPFDTQEELESWMLSLQEQVRELFTAYLAEYNFSLEQIQDLGQQTISLPNGSQVETTQIQVELSIVDLLNMVHYSLNHFVEDAAFQEAFLNMVVEMTLLEEGKTTAELSASEVAEMKASLQAELNPALKEMAAELETFITEELSAYEEVLLGAASFVIDTYIGVSDKEVYQQDYRLNLTYTEELSQLAEEQAADAPFVPGDSISLEMSQQIWNHNEELEAIAVPEQLISMEEIEAMESVDEFKEVAGENSFLAQIAEHILSFMGDVTGDFSFVELKVNENRAETMTGEQDALLYIKDGQLMAPISLVGESMGAEVSWNEESRHITVNSEAHNLQVDTVNNYTVTIDGEVRADLAVEIIEGTSYVNVRPFAEAMGWSVLWMEETQSALIVN